MLKAVELYPSNLSEASWAMLFQLVRGFSHIVRGDIGLAEFAARIAMVYDTGKPKVQEALSFLDRLYSLTTQRGN